MGDFALDAFLALQWFFEEKMNRDYSLAALASLSKRRAVVPMLGSMESGMAW